MKPMLAKTLGPNFSSWPCYVQPKLNGIRALCQHGTFQSRDEKFWNLDVLRHLEDELKQIKDGLLNPGHDAIILDGELYVHGWKLQRINAAVAVNRKEPTVDTPNVCFHVFDVVDPNRSFSNRWFEIYHGLIAAELPHVKAVPTSLVADRNEMDRSFNLYTREGYEGIMIRPDGPYEFGEHHSVRTGTFTQFRSKFLWKHKQWEEDEFECIGVTQGEGKADIGIGALICGCSVPITDGPISVACPAHFKVGTGFSDEERIKFMQNPPIGKLVKIRYLCLTEDGIPFNPSFQCVMAD